MEKITNLDLYNLYNSLGRNINMSYKGPFTSEILAFLGNYIRVIMSKYPRASNKLFKVFIELAQNISYYSVEMASMFEDQEDGVGIVVICEYEDYYILFAGNMVKDDHAKILLDKCNYINSLNKEELRQFKREQRGREKSERSGANIGLIHSALTSENPLEADVREMTGEYSFFSISVRIEK